MRISDSPETSIYLFIYLFIYYHLFIILQARAERFLLGIYVFFTAWLFRYFRPSLSPHPPSPPLLPTLRWSSDGDTDRKRASDKTSR